jgi:hypothetical protein
VTYQGTTYPAASLVGGAAFELFADTPQPGFLRNPQVGVAPYHRFVHVSEVLEGDSSTDPPLRVPLSRGLGWEHVHQLTQTPAYGRPPSGLLTTIRRSAEIKRGTRMMKILSARQASGHLRGWLPQGFCYREYDIAHLRTLSDLAVLGSEPAGDQAIYALRWRATDPSDYDVPFARSGADYAGLADMPSHDRVGPPVIGTGFAPSGSHVIPEFVTADVADLPMPANASLVAYTADGVEVVLYTYQPEQRGWTRMAGPQWRHLLTRIPNISPDQEYLRVDMDGSSRLVGRFRGEEYEAVADPPVEFRVLAMTRAARYPVEALARRTRYCSWRGAVCTVIREEGAWVRLRLVRPDPENVALLGAQCYERGVYEVWAPTAEATDRRVVDRPYEI